MTPGAFIDPDPSLEALANPAESLNIPIYSGYRGVEDARAFAGRNRVFDAIVERLRTLDLPYEDQCSIDYYFDLVRSLRDMNGEFDRVVEVGVFMGGSSSFLAGCMEPFGFELDMVDVSAPYLRFAYERVRRMYPEAAKRIRLFHGDLPAYVRRVIMAEGAGRHIVHHDGAHDFNTVVKDLASLYYVKERLHAVIAQDTHLRGAPKYMNFVDLALFAVFGANLSYAPIGASYGVGDGRTEPNQYQGNYFLPDTPEGLVLPMAANEFRYPHPLLNMDDFLPPAA